MVTRIRSWTLAAGLATVFGLSYGNLSYGVVVPAGLDVGDEYHLVFVTQGRRDATDIFISDYDAFVQTEAARNPSLTGTDEGVAWKAIASTNFNAARDHALVEAPVYLMDGTTLVAAGYSDMWDSTLSAAIELDQYGMTNESIVWTGTWFDGRAWSGADHELGKARPGFGFSQGLVAAWVWWDFSISPTDEWPLYALSEKLVVPVPEPTSLVLAAVALLAWASRGMNTV